MLPAVLAISWLGQPNNMGPKKILSKEVDNIKKSLDFLTEELVERVKVLHIQNAE